jgi:hypothetical protein
MHGGWREDGMSATAAPQAAAALEAPAVWCDQCGQPLTVGGRVETIAVHTETGGIFGEDGHLAGPTEDAAKRDAA